jgi:cobalt-zinc-cadmium efflux system outer membrane protein
MGLREIIADKRDTILVLGLAFFSGLPWGNGVTWAQRRPPEAAPLALDDAVGLAVRDNASLRSLRAKWRAMQERPLQARALPNPMFTYGGMDLANGGHWPNTDEKRFMVEQEFSWFGKRGLREEIARKDAEAMQYEVEAMTRDVVMMVKETYFDLYAVQRVIEVTRSDGDVLERMAKIAETMYTTGDRSQQDVLKAKAEITMLKQRLLELDAQETTLKAKLNTLMNRRADTPAGRAVTPPEVGFSGDVEPLFALAVTNRPEVRSAQTQIERYQLEKKLMVKEVMPDYKLGLEYRDFVGGDDMVMFTVSMDLPLWRSKYRAGVREAQRMVTASHAAREAAERQSALDVQDASFKLLTARRTLDLYRTELIPQAQARFKASEADYQTGKVDFMDLLESQRFLLSARVMAVMAEGNLGMQSARLERAVGQELKTGVPPAQAATKKGTEYGN